MIESRLGLLCDVLRAHLKPIEVMILEGLVARPLRTWCPGCEALLAGMVASYGGRLLELGVIDDYLNPRDYMTAALARRLAQRTFVESDVEPTGAQFEAWVAGCLASYREDGRVISDQQMTDLMAKRVLLAGDRVRYVGPDRSEGDYARPSGQLGTIVGVEFVRADGRRVCDLTFAPDDGTQNLRVRYGTPSYWLLERVPEAP